MENVQFFFIVKEDSTRVLGHLLMMPPPPDQFWINGLESRGFIPNAYKSNYHVNWPFRSEKYRVHKYFLFSLSQMQQLSVEISCLKDMAANLIASDIVGNIGNVSTTSSIEFLFLTITIA